MNLSMICLAISASVALSVPSASQPCSEPLGEVQILEDGGTHSIIGVEEYVARVVAHEVPHTFNTEAIKAQAVAARTYLYYCLANNSHPHNGADVCTDITHCCGYITEETLAERYGIDYAVAAMETARDAAYATEGEIMRYDGKPIMSVWHSSSSGFTENCSAVWLGELPYLTSVPSRESVDTVTVSFSHAEAAQRLRSAGYNYNMKQFLNMTYTDSGRCDTLTLGNVTLDGSAVRTIFGLRSTDFHAVFGGGRLYFTVRGYGHGVGMSQYGAETMAEGGATYREILTHYYTGCVIE